jgi:predicted GTPase
MDHFSKKKQLDHLYNELSQQSDNVIPDNLKISLNKRREELGQEKFQIAFVGRFSTGKSFLINRLFLEDDLLPVANRPTTARTLHLTYGANKVFKLVHSDNRIEEVEATKSNIKKFTTHMGERKDDYEYFQLEWPDQTIFKNGVSIVDTIGTEDIDDDYVSATYTAIEQSNAVVVLLSILQPFSQSEQDFISQQISNTGKKVFLIVTKSDVRTPEEQQEVYDDLKKRFSNFYREQSIRVDERIFMVSAKTGLNMKNLKDRLISFLAQDRLKELTDYHKESINELLKTLDQTMASRLNEIRIKKSGNEKELKQIKLDMDKLEQDLEKKDDDFLDLEEELILFAETETEDTLRQREMRIQQDIARRNNLDTQKMSEAAGIAVAEAEQKLSRVINREVRDRFNKRIVKWNPRLDPDEFSKVNLESNTVDASVIAAHGTKIGGVAMTGWGAYSVIQGIMTASTAGILTEGIIFQTINWATMGSIGGMALPWVAAGIPMIWIGKKLAEKFTDENEKKLHENAKQSTKNIFYKASKEIQSHLGQYIHTIVEQERKAFKSAIKRESQRLQALIEEKNTSKLEVDVKQFEHNQRAIQQLLEKSAAI